MYDLQFVHSIDEINPLQWDQTFPTNHPFTQHRFLSALESSGSVSADTGWQPLHVVVYQQNKIIAAMPMYIKNHSYGEYVFDWAWADAYHHYGWKYYPKLLTAIPFTPSVSARIGCAIPELRSNIETLIIEQVTILAKQLNLSGWHILFAQQKLVESEQIKLLKRTSMQYHWHNRGYQSFSHYLEHFKGRKRKNVLKERQKVLQQRIEIKQYSGETLTQEKMKSFYPLYLSTYHKRGREAYLNEAFFLKLVEQMPEQMLLITAHLKDQLIAGALFFFDDHSLYGRYWGCNQSIDSLHFELCYYQGIEFCIANHLKRFDPGTQGEHKISRGFEPTLTHSYHWLKEKQLTPAITAFLDEEYDWILQQQKIASRSLPFQEIKKQTVVS